MSFRRPLQPNQGVGADEVEERELRLSEAETRADTLFERAAWLHSVVSRRDRENRWQDSVNRLFLGGQV